MLVSAALAAVFKEANTEVKVTIKSNFFIVLSYSGWLCRSSSTRIGQPRSFMIAGTLSIAA